MMIFFAMRFFLICTLLTFIWNVQAGWTKDMTFSIVYLNHTNIVVADGEITLQTPDSFETFLATEPFDGFRFIVALNSNGGSLIGGLRLGQIIREQKLETIVARYPIEVATGEHGRARRPGGCYSACAVAFLGGVQRNVPESSQIGFHQFSSAGGSQDARDSVYLTESTAQLIGATMLGYIMNMGAKPALFARLSEALPEQMWIPGPEELVNYAIVTPESFRDFSFEPYGAGVISYAVLPENVSGRSVVAQVTAYCKDNTPYLLLSAIEPKYAPGAEARKSIAEMQSGFDISVAGGRHTLSYPPEAVSIRLAEGLPLAELRLDARGVAAITRNPIQLSVSFPGAIGASFHFATDPTGSDKAALEAAFRICIR